MFTSLSAGAVPTNHTVSVFGTGHSDIERLALLYDVTLSNGVPMKCCCVLFMPRCSAVYSSHLGLKNNKKKKKHLITEKYKHINSLLDSSFERTH